MAYLPSQFLSATGDGSGLTGITPAQVGALAPAGDGSALTGVAKPADISLSAILTAAGVSGNTGSITPVTSLTTNQGIVVGVS